ncbi:unnamed protein product [Prunus brigantina]
MEQFKGQPQLPKGYDIMFKPDLTACNFCGALPLSSTSSPISMHLLACFRQFTKQNKIKKLSSFGIWKSYSIYLGVQWRSIMLLMLMK